VVDASQWRRALVTGASSGIGEAFADELASMHVDLILVGRDRAALERVASRARTSGVRVEVLRADLSNGEDVAGVVGVIHDAHPPIDLLVNNAGVGQWGGFVDLPVEGAIEILRVNDEAVVQLTHAAVAAMLDAGRGTIIQMASMASAAPGPNQAVYAASKAFVSSFGQAISSELAATPVTCTTILPGFTRTNYFSRVGLSPDIPETRWMTAQQVARASLDGARQGRPLVIPGARNRWKIAIATQFPSLAVGRVKRRTRWALQSVQAGKRRITGLVPRSASSAKG
jgi:short-subunit dehydrogenase